MAYYALGPTYTAANGGTSPVNTTTGAFSSNVTIGGTLGVTGLSTFTGGATLPATGVLLWTSSAKVTAGTGSTNGAITIATSSGSNGVTLDGSGGRLTVGTQTYGQYSSVFATHYIANDASGAAANQILIQGVGAASPVIYCGTGAPTVSANKGCIYLRTDGSAGNTLYYNASGSTTWNVVA